MISASRLNKPLVFIELAVPAAACTAIPAFLWRKPTPK
jgi:hypothetical protein